MFRELQFQAAKNVVFYLFYLKKFLKGCPRITRNAMSKPQRLKLKFILNFLTKRRA